MFAKGRVKCPNTQLPSSLEQVCIWIFDERSEPENRRFFGSLPVTKSRVKCPNTQLSGLLEQMCIWKFDERSEPVKPEVFRVSARN